MRITRSELRRIITESLSSRRLFYSDLMDWAGGVTDNLMPPVFKTLSSGVPAVNKAAGRVYKQLFRKYADHKYFSSLSKIHVSNTEDFRINSPVLPKDELSCVVFNDENKKNRFINSAVNKGLSTGLNIVNFVDTFPLVFEFERGRITYCEARGLASGYRQSHSSYKQRMEKPSVERDLTPEKLAASYAYYTDKYGEEGIDILDAFLKKKYDKINSDPKNWANQFSSGNNKLPNTPSMPNMSIGQPGFDHLQAIDQENPLKSLILDQEDFEYFDNKIHGLYPNEAFIANWKISVIYVPVIKDLVIREQIIDQLNNMKQAVGNFEIVMI